MRLNQRPRPAREGRPSSSRRCPVRLALGRRRDGSRGVVGDVGRFAEATVRYTTALALRLVLEIWVRTSETTARPDEPRDTLHAVGDDKAVHLLRRSCAIKFEVLVETTRASRRCCAWPRLLPDGPVAVFSKKRSPKSKRPVAVAEARKLRERAVAILSNKLGATTPTSKEKPSSRRPEVLRRRELFIERLTRGAKQASEPRPVYLPRRAPCGPCRRRHHEKWPASCPLPDSVGSHRSPSSAAHAPPRADGRHWVLTVPASLAVAVRTTDDLVPLRASQGPSERALDLAPPSPYIGNPPRSSSAWHCYCRGGIPTRQSTSWPQRGRERRPRAPEAPNFDTTTSPCTTH